VIFIDGCERFIDFSCSGVVGFDGKLRQGQQCQSFMVNVVVDDGVLSANYMLTIKNSIVRIISAK
jgi:hypothetical protein